MSMSWFRAGSSSVNEGDKFMKPSQKSQRFPHVIFPEAREDFQLLLICQSRWLSTNTGVCY